MHGQHGGSLSPRTGTWEGVHSGQYLRAGLRVEETLSVGTLARTKPAWPVVGQNRLQVALTH